MFENSKGSRVYIFSKIASLAKTQKIKGNLKSNQLAASACVQNGNKKLAFERFTGQACLWKSHKLTSAKEIALQLHDNSFKVSPTGEETRDDSDRVFMVVSWLSAFSGLKWQGATHSAESLSINVACAESAECLLLQWKEQLAAWRASRHL